MADPVSDEEKDSADLLDLLTIDEEEEEQPDNVIKVRDVKEKFSKKSKINTPSVNTFLETFGKAPVTSSAGFKETYSHHQEKLNKVSGKNRAEKVEFLKDAPFEIPVGTSLEVIEEVDTPKDKQTEDDERDIKIERLEEENDKLHLELQQIKAKTRLSALEDNDIETDPDKTEKIKSWGELNSSKQKKRILKDVRESLKTIADERCTTVTVLLGELLVLENYARYVFHWLNQILLI